MHFRRFLAVRLPSLRTSLGLSLVAFTVMLSSSGCMERKLTGIYVEPTAACLAPGGTAQITAYGVYTEGGHAAVTKEVNNLTSWDSDLTEVATVSSTGFVTAVDLGLTNIRAKAQGEFGVLYSFSNVTVLAGTDCLKQVTGAVRLQIVPGKQTMVAGDTLSPLAIDTTPGKLNTDDVTSRVTWESSNPAVATVRGGVITAVGTGDVVITATQMAADGTPMRATQDIHVTAEAAQE